MIFLLTFLFIGFHGDSLHLNPDSYCQGWKFFWWIHEHIFLPLENRNIAIKFKISDISELHRFADSNVKILDWQKDFELINQFYKDGFFIYDLLKNDPDEFESLGTAAYVKDGKILSLADIMKIKENELQIGAVATLPAERNKGYCKAVVSAAAERILSLGYAAQLTTKNNNIAMQKVAKAIGMTADID